MDYILTRLPNGKVSYLMKQKGANVTGETGLEAALWMLKDGEKKCGGVRRSDEFEGYITADGVYFFRGEVAESDQGNGGALSPADAGTSPSADGEAKDGGTGDTTSKDCEDFCEIPAAELGADGLPMPAGAERPKRKKRARDEGRE